MEPTGSWGRLRSVNRPVPARVRVGAEGAPAAVEVRRRWRPVEVVQERWRVDEGWWWERPVSRMYWRLVLAGGRQITVYEDLAGKSWWVQRA